MAADVRRLPAQEGGAGEMTLFVDKEYPTRNEAWEAFDKAVADARTPEPAAV